MQTVQFILHTILSITLEIFKEKNHTDVLLFQKFLLQKKFRTFTHLKIIQTHFLFREKHIDTFFRK